MGQIDQHQASTVVVPQPGDGLASSVPRATQNATLDAYNAHDADSSIHVITGLSTARPAASALPDTVYFSVDTLQASYSNGSSWSPWNYSDGSPVPNESDMLFLFFSGR